MQILRIIFSVLFILGGSLTFLSAQERSASELIDEANKLLRGQSSHSEMTMTISTPKWERKLAIEAWNQGREKSLMRIHSPAKERGNGTLKISKELWNWLPAVERVIKIPPSMMNSSWMGSDFTYNDVVKADSVVKDYTHKILEKKFQKDGTMYLIEALPKEEAAVVWGKILMEIFEQGQDILPVKEEDYSERGEKMRTLEFLEVKEMSGKRIPTHVECTPHKKVGHKTVITYKKFETDLTFQPHFFSLKTLQRPLE